MILNSLILTQDAIFWMKAVIALSRFRVPWDIKGWLLVAGSKCYQVVALCSWLLKQVGLFTIPDEPSQICLSGMNVYNTWMSPVRFVCQVRMYTCILPGEPSRICLPGENVYNTW